MAQFVWLTSTGTPAPPQRMLVNLEQVVCIRADSLGSRLAFAYAHKGETAVLVVEESPEEIDQILNPNPYRATTSA